MWSSMGVLPVLSKGRNRWLLDSAQALKDAKSLKFAHQKDDLAAFSLRENEKEPGVLSPGPYDTHHRDVILL